MKYCPVCETRYDEEIMRFCTKDGTPLIDEDAPNFVGMPSKDLEMNEEDDFGAETVIRRKTPESETTNVEPRMGETSQRIVVPTSEPMPSGQQVRTKQQAAYQQPPPKKTSTAAVVLLTVFGTIAVLGGGLGIYWLMSGGKSSPAANSNTNLNTNQDTNLNTNLNIDNSLFNINSDVNVNANVNANVSPSPTKTPTPSPSPTKTPTPSPTPDDDDDNTNSGNSNSGAPVNTRPTATPTPRPSPPPANTPVNVGNMNTRAISLVKPVYPPVARQIRASGQVPVQVVVDETGKVISAKATGGHPLLRQAAENAARTSRFNPVRVSGQPVKSVGTVVYNFVSN